ncbi:MAG: family 16 glycosylhydrolase [Treponema sp.]|nr:family 16 glycosylhydrolase [Treponema sp.]
MKKTLALAAAAVVFFGFTSCGKKDVPVTEIKQYEGYTLLWNDEFDGEQLNESIWNIERRAPGWVNSELQEYTNSPENIFVKDGFLTIKALKTKKGSRDHYTSGKVQTCNKQDFKYGKVVTRAKIPAGQGLWPAIWMMPTNVGIYGQWPRCGEIDILEILGNDPKTAYGTIHFGNPHMQRQGIYKLENGSFADDYHEFTVDWEPDSIRYYIDDVLFFETNDWYSASGNVVKPYPAPFNQRFYVQLNLAVGGDWPGNPDKTTNFNKADFKIDYVRVYQKAAYDENIDKPGVKLPSPDGTGNLVMNGNFDKDISYDEPTGWKFYSAQGGDGSVTIKDNVMSVETKLPGSEDYAVQVYYAFIGAARGKTYKITFDAKAAEDRKMKIAVTAPDRNYIRYLNDTPVELTKDWKTYTFEYTMNHEDDPTARLEFNMGHAGSKATIDFRKVRVEKID